MNRKANLFRLYPTPEQNAQMAQIDALVNRLVRLKADAPG
jgi:Helix-turn-helix domain